MSFVLTIVFCTSEGAMFIPNVVIAGIVQKYISYGSSSFMFAYWIWVYYFRLIIFQNQK